MPELPEVETVCAGLRTALEGARLQDVTVRRHDLRRPIPEDFVNRIRGQKVLAIKRRSKYILMELDSGLCLIVHLGMSGCMRILQGNPPPPDKHDHVEFMTDRRTCIRFADPRRFGFFDIIEAGELENDPALRKLGPEPFDPGFTAPYLKSALKNKTATMKAALMDQRIVAGLGNIYVNEALFRARISPTKKAGKLSLVAAQRLVPVIVDVLNEAIASGGSSLRDHRRTDGELGYFQHNFQVYGRAGDPCPSCTTSAIRRIVQQGRSTFYCRICQK